MLPPYRLNIHTYTLHCTIVRLPLVLVPSLSLCLQSQDVRNFINAWHTDISDWFVWWSSNGKQLHSTRQTTKINSWNLENVLRKFFFEYFAFQKKNEMWQSINKLNEIQSELCRGIELAVFTVFQSIRSITVVLICKTSFIHTF